MPGHTYSKSLPRVICLLILLFGVRYLTACVTLPDPEASQEHNSVGIGTINKEQNIGQTFVSRRSRLNGITIWLSTVPTTEILETSSEFLSITLFHHPEHDTPIFTTTIPATSIGQNSQIQVSIPAQPDPPGQEYYILFNTDNGNFQVNGRNEDAYSAGQAYINQNPFDADIAFRLTYEYDFSSALDDAKTWIIKSWLLAPLGLLLILPGWLLLNLSGINNHFTKTEIFIMSISISLAIIPVLMLWTTLVNIQWNNKSIYFVAGLLTAITILIKWGKFPGSSALPAKTVSLEIKEIHKRTISNYRLALACIFVFTLAVRLAMIRDLATPAWVDSVHHSLITRIIMENGAFPKTYAPYFDLEPTYYHPGFHSLTASFLWLSGLDIPNTLLIFGQVLNALVALSVYLLAISLTRDRMAGLVAALITGLFTPMPAYYTSWGRYTQLVGLLILPTVLALFSFAQERQDNPTRVKAILLTSLALGGLFLIHYRVAAYMLCLLLAFSISRFQLVHPVNIQALKNTLLTSIWVGIGMSILTLPWLQPTIQKVLLPGLIARNVPETTFFSDFSWRYLTTAYGTQAMAIAALGLLWSIIRKERFVITLSLWMSLLLVLANLDALGLPGGGFVNNTSVEITFFMPISVFGGYFISNAINAWKAFLTQRWNVIFNWSVALIGTALAFLGARQLLPILNPITFLSRSADQTALEWINENIPLEEKILINPFLWGYGTYAGQDGGYWITPVTARKTIPPPVLYDLSNPGERELINTICSEVINNGDDADALWSLLKTHSIRFVYVGARGGVISPKALTNSGLFATRYMRDGVWIFEILP